MTMQLIEDIMTRDVISAPPQTPIPEIFKLLSQQKISFVVITEDDKAIGVITERDIVNFTARKIDTEHLQAYEVMSKPVIVVNQCHVDVAEAYHRLKLQNKRHLVVVDHTGRMTGVVTLTDFIHHLGVEAFINHKPLSQVLTSDPITVSPSDTMDEAISLMATNKISSMIVAKKGKPVGIITERDIARLRSSGERDMLSKRVDLYMSHPLITVTSDMNTYDASKLMASKHIRHLVVTDHKGMVSGVVTETNIVRGMEGRYVQSLVQLLDEKDEELRMINAELESRVKQRTAELSKEVEAHKTARDAMKKLTQALKQASEAVIITDTKGNIEYVNDAFTRTTGYSIDEVLGKNPRILQSGRQDISFYKHMWASLLHEDAWNGVVWNKRKNGELYPEQLNIRSIKNNCGEIINFVGTFSDITEKLAIEAEHRHAQKMEAIGALVGGVAHNFNNILAGMMGKIYLARHKTALPEEAIPYIDSLENLSNQAADMVRQLLTFARKERLQKQVFPVADMMREALKTVRFGIPEDIQLIADLGDEPLNVMGDASQLQQVLMNMINNARDAMTESFPRTISVSLRRFNAGIHFYGDHAHLNSKALACLSIEDSGSGINAIDLEHIFEPFYSTKEVGKGTGLGLSMSRGAVESHGGAIEVKSTPGKGTVFNIYLPLAYGVPDEHDKESPEICRGNGELILLVDDESLVLESIKGVLETLDYRIITADNGEGGLALFNRHKNELSAIITDIVMPEMGGFTFAEQIRTSSDLPIIFLTGYDFESQAKELTSNSTLISKPFNVQKFSSLLNQIIHP